MNEQTIIAMSGRKCAGKNTIGQWICRWYAESQISYNGLTDDVADALIEKVKQDSTFECSFADNLKDFLIDTLGLRREQCYGTDDEKNSPTEYSWEGASPFLAWKFGTRDFVEVIDQAERFFAHYREVADSETLREAYYDPRESFCDKYHIEQIKPIGHRTGLMTGRDIMQVFGTDLIRETFGNVWAKATIRRIKKAGRPLSVITDNRFPNEVEAVLAEPKGYIIRLTRSPFGNHDIHPSEAALDNFDWNRDKCYVLDNAAMTLEEQNEAVIPILQEILGAKR